MWLLFETIDYKEKFLRDIICIKYKPDPWLLVP